MKTEDTEALGSTFRSLWTFCDIKTQLGQFATLIVSCGNSFSA